MKNTVAVLLFYFALSANPVFSENLTPLADRESIRLEQQQLLIKQQQRIDELKKLPGKKQPLIEQLGTDDELCFKISRVNFDGISILKESELNNTRKKYKNSCMGISSINQLVREITNLYIEKGYITTRAYIPQQNLNDGTLKIKVVEGSVEAFTASEEQLRLSEINFALPNINGNPLNLRDLEQGIDQINRLPSNQASFKLIPGEEVGSSIVQVENTKEKPWRVAISKNNYGDVTTGKQQWSTRFEWDSPLGFNDQFKIFAGHDAVSDSDIDSRNVFFEYSIPYGKWTSSYNFSFNNYQQYTVSNGYKYFFSGDNRNHRLNFERLLYRDHQSKLNTVFSLSHVRTRNYSEGRLIEKINDETKSHQLTEYSLGVNYGRIIVGGFLNTDLNYHRGTRWFGADNDKHIQPNHAEAQYEKYSVTSSFVRPFQLSSQELSFGSVLHGQWTNDVLKSPVRFSVGGQSSVRGFDEQSLTGDSGYYWRNELSWQIPKIKSLTSNVITHSSLVLAYDVGAIHSGKYNEDQSGRLSGRAIGIRLNGEHINMELFVAESLSRPGAVSQSEQPIYYRIEFTF